MADLTEISDALVALVAQAAYPSGTGQPSVVGFPVKVYAGWPAEAQLDADLIAGVANVTVFPRQDERNTSSASKDWQQQAVNTATITATVVGQAITIGGAMPSPFFAHNCAILANNKHYVYSVQAGDTLTTIATALAALLAVDFPGSTNVGPVITAAAGARIAAARVGTIGTMIRELGRQERVFQVTVWANTPANRTALSKALDVALRDAERLTMPDTSIARLSYRGAIEQDMLQKAKLYKRDILFAVEYSTTQQVTAYQVTQETITISPAFEDMDDPVATATINI